MKKNILIISPEYPPETGCGGIGTYVHDFSHIIQKLGNLNVDVLSVSYAVNQKYRDDGINIYRVKISRNPLLRYVAITKWILRNYHKYDYIEDELFGGYCAFPRMILGKKFQYITKIHGTSREMLVLERYKTVVKRITISMTGVLERYSARNSLAVISSCSLTSNYSFMLFDIDYSKQFTQPLPYTNPVSGDYSGYKISLPDKYFLFVGRTQKKKGSQVLLNLIPKLLSRYKDFSFVILGADIENFKKIFSNNTRVQFIDHTYDQTMYRHIINKSHITILPSQFESFLYTGLHTIQENVTIVISGNCGITEYFNDSGSGFVVKDVNSVEDYIEAIDQIMKNYEASKFNVKELDNHLKNVLSPEIITKKYLKILINSYEKQV